MRFSIVEDAIQSRVQSLNDIKGEIDSINANLQDIIDNTSIQMDSYDDIKQTLKILNQNIRTLSASTASLGAGLQSSLNSYRSHEEAVIGHAGHVGTVDTDGKSGVSPQLMLLWSKIFPVAAYMYPLMVPVMGAIAPNIFGNFWNRYGYNDSSDGKFSWSVLGGKNSEHTNFHGIDAGYDGEYHVGHLKAGWEGSAKWDLDKGEFGAGIKGKASTTLVDGKISGNIGLLKGTLEGSLIGASAEGAVGATLFTGGKFDPKVYGKASAEAHVASGKISEQFGTDDNNIHSKAEGTLLGGKAEAGIQAGKIIEEKDGQKKEKFGVSANAGSEAYVAQGSVSAGFTIFGIKIDGSLEGKAGGAGIKVGTEATTGGIEGEIGAGLLLGLGIKVKVDWTDFKWEKLPFLNIGK